MDRVVRVPLRFGDKTRTEGWTSTTGYSRTQYFGFVSPTSGVHQTHPPQKPHTHTQAVAVDVLLITAWSSNSLGTLCVLGAERCDTIQKRDRGNIIAWAESPRSTTTYALVVMLAAHPSPPQSEHRKWGHNGSRDTADAGPNPFSTFQVKIGGGRRRGLCCSRFSRMTTSSLSSYYWLARPEAKLSCLVAEPTNQSSTRIRILYVVVTNQHVGWLVDWSGDSLIG